MQQFLERKRVGDYSQTLYSNPFSLKVEQEDKLKSYDFFVSKDFVWLYGIDEILAWVSVLLWGDADSDLDIGLEIAGVSREVMRNSDFAKESLKPLQKALFDAGLKNKFITHTRIPLLRLKNAPIPTEICLYDSYNGKKAFYLTSICKEDPRTGPFL